MTSSKKRRNERNCFTEKNRPFDRFFVFLNAEIAHDLLGDTFAIELILMEQLLPFTAFRKTEHADSVDDARYCFTGDFADG